MSGVSRTGGSYRRLTASANIAPRAGASIVGLLTASTSSGTIQFYDDVATGTTTPVTGVITPAAGSWTSIPISTMNGVYVVITGTLDCTVVIA